MEKDPEKRAKPHQALVHPFLCEASRHLDQVIAQDIVSELRFFS